MSNPHKPTWLIDGVPDSAGGPDRGSQFGDGVFETMAAANGRIPALERHLQRLERGCVALGLPEPDRDRLVRDIESLLPSARRAVIKVIVGPAGTGRGYARPAGAGLTHRVGCLPWPSRLPETLSVTVCRIRLAAQPALAGIKHCNRLEQILARREVDAAGADEGLMRDRDDRIVEGVAANVFVVRHGVLQTPPLDQCGVAGVMRSRVLEAAEQLGVATQVTPLLLTDILEADELFMTNSLIGVRRVHRLTREAGAQEWNPGPITNRIREGVVDQ
jgi:4-amino-4-deoxychorismate lyase